MITLSYLWLPYMILPMYAGLERLPNSLLEASADLGASTATTMRRIVLPVLFPAAVAGSIFAFSLTLGDYIAVKIVGGANQMLGNVVYDNFLTGNNMPFAAAVVDDPGRDHAGLPGGRAADGSAGEPVSLSRLTRTLLARPQRAARSCSSTRRWRWCCSTPSTPPARSPGRRRA